MRPRWSDATVVGCGPPESPEMPQPDDEIVTLHKCLGGRDAQVALVVADRAVRALTTVGGVAVRPGVSDPPRAGPVGSEPVMGNQSFWAAAVRTVRAEGHAAENGSELPRARYDKITRVISDGA